MKEEQKLHELLCAYVLGEADAQECATVEAALAESAELRAEQARLEATIGLVQTTLGGEESLSPAAEEELFAKAGFAQAAAPGPKPLRSSPPIVSPPIWSQPAFRMAAALALIVGGVLAGTRLLDAPQHAPAEVARLAPGDERDARDERAGARRVLSKSAGALEAEAPRDQAAAAPIAKAREVRGGEIRLQVGGEAPSSQAFEDNEVEIAEPIVEEELELDSLADLGYVGKEGGVEYDRAEPMEEGNAFVAGHESIEPREFEKLGYTEAKREVTGKDLLGLDDGSKNERGRKSGARPSVEAAEAPGRVSRGGGDLYAHRAVNAPATKKQTESKPGASLGLRPSEERAGGNVVVSDERYGAGGGAPAGPAAPGAGAPKPTPLRNGASSTGGSEYFLGEGERQDGAAEYRFNGGRREIMRHDAAVVGQLFEAFANGRDDVVARLWIELRRDDLSLSDLLIRECRRRPRETPSMMFHRFYGDNAFETALSDPLSTFSVDVDTASYALARNYLLKGLVPPKAAVRTEEFVNYFDPDIEAPLEGDFAIHTDLAPSRFGGPDPSRWMMRVVVRGREVSREERQPLSLTFAVDTSGSMQRENRLELVKHALRLLIGELDANDSIALVAFSSEARMVLPMTSVARRDLIETAIHGLKANGSTNAEGGLKMAYTIAHASLHPNAANRVVFLSDGVANVGQTDQNRIAEDIAGHRKKGIYLNTIGVGMGNHNDVFLEQLADKGDGMCNYVDSEREAYRAIVENFTGAFQPIGRDVKIQVEFDPSQVASYRLLGYENRAIADVDFRNDAVDAGEVGSGHQVTALYELVRVPGTTGEGADGPLATVRLRWKAPHGAEVADPEKASEMAHSVVDSGAASSFAGTSLGYRRAVLVAQFAEFLRRSVHCREDSLDELIAEAAKLEAEVEDPDWSELVSLLRQSRQLVLQNLPLYDELARAIDALREREILLARYEALLDEEAERQKADDRDFLQKIEVENRELEDKIRELIEKRLEKGVEGKGRR